jgi:DNA-binding GntR family transcriptional regulator
VTGSPLLPWDALTDRSPLAARIAAAAARGVVERRYDAGTLLTEADLAEAEGASRTPAREAMLQLEAWGLVRLLPKKGALVVPVTPEERRDLLAVRAMFETHAVESVAAAGALPPGLAGDLHALLDRQRTALDAGDVLGFAGGDYAFHARIIRSGGNAVVTGIVDRLGPRLARLVYEVATGRPDRLATLLAEHEALAEHALAGDGPGFARAVQQHLATGHLAQEGRA